MRVCSIEGCDRKHYGHGWCNMHWNRWRRLGDAGAKVAAHWTLPDECIIDGCSNRARTRGWCANHYRHWRIKGDPLWPHDDPRAQCTICRRADRSEVDEALSLYVPLDAVHGYAAIARRFGVTSSSLRRHNSADHARTLARRSLEYLEQARRVMAS